MSRNFIGPFADLLSDFVEFKRSMGYKYKKEEGILHLFSLFTVQAGINHPELTKDICILWCSKRPHEQYRPGLEQRISCLRQFALYLVSIGYPTYIPINLNNTISRKTPYVAYVFSHEEMQRIIECSDEICPNRQSTMHLVMPVLIRLLHSTGLRILEALTLQIKHVDFSLACLTIENAKFDKDRLVPLSASMTDVLKQYCQVLHPACCPEEYLFSSITRQPYSHHSIYLRFRELLLKAGIPHAGRGNGPRIHDIRHTFGCHTLQAAVSRNVDLYAALPILSTYLGHESLQATSRYLRMTSEVYPSIVSAVNEVCSHVIPGGD